jgi:HEAT repeat protein
MLLNHHLSFQSLLDALLDEAKPLNPRYLYRLSDLESEEIAQLDKVWGRIPLWRRKALLEDLEELSQTNNLLSFEAIGRYAIRDQDPQVRCLAINLLFDYETVDLIPNFIELAQKDEDYNVRAAAAMALGQYIYLGEIEELPAKTLRKIEECLLKVLASDEAAEVRRRALESLGFSSREEVPHLIENAFRSGSREWMASALFAMGRSFDQRWKDIVLKTLDHKVPSLREEAARAAGELEIREAVPLLIELLKDSEDDVRDAAIWSLSQIGGEGVREVLEQLLDEAEEDDEISFLENALDNLSFTDDLQTFSLFEFDQDDLEPKIHHSLWEEDEDFLDIEDDDEDS